MRCRLFSWEHSYFSGKVRAYLRYKERMGDLGDGFEIGGIRSRRMVVPYQIWMLQRIAVVLDTATASERGRASVGSWLAGFPGGPELFELNERLADCRVRKDGARLFSIG